MLRLALQLCPTLLYVLGKGAITCTIGRFYTIRMVWLLLEPRIVSYAFHDVGKLGVLSRHHLGIARAFKVFLALVSILALLTCLEPPIVCLVLLAFMDPVTSGGLLFAFLLCQPRQFIGSSHIGLLHLFF